MLATTRTLLAGSAARTGIAAGLMAVSFVAFLAAANPTVARPSFDGEWSVVIITRKGDCEGSVRYPIRIANGFLHNAGFAPVDISGRVGGSGAITVRVAFGDKSASGSGRLSGASGSGSWSGGACRGVWTAERRS
jgi:hypothetical protein